MTNNRKFFLLIVAFLALQGVGVASSPTVKSHDVTKDIVVTFVSSKPKFVSGLIATWIRIESVDSYSNSQEFFLPFLNKDIELPSIGSICRVTYFTSSISGYVGAESSKINKKTSYIVTNLDCRM